MTTACLHDQFSHSLTVEKRAAANPTIANGAGAGDETIAHKYNAYRYRYGLSISARRRHHIKWARGQLCGWKTGDGVGIVHAMRGCTEGARQMKEVGILERR